MSFLPPVVMEMRANASQFLSEQGKVIASAKTTAEETEKAAQKQAAAARTAAAEAKRAADQQVLASDTAAKAAQVAADKRVAAEARAAEATQKATQMQTDSLGVMTREQQAAYDKQVAAAERAANAVDLASAKEVQAQDKAAAAATLAAETQKKAADLQVVAAEKTAAAQEVAATRTKTAMNSVVGVANKISAASLLAAGAVAIGSVEMASKFEKSTMLLVTAGGESMNALSGVRQGILDISTQTGTSAEQMSEGMYIMEKAGFRGAAGLAALKASAQGAKDENVDLQIMAQATTDVLLDYGYKMDTVAHATDSSVRVTNMLVAASGAAKTTMTDFAGSMSAVIPIASTAKISFDQIGGAIATMTQHGQTAQQSSQNLANLIQSLVRPNNLASAAMSQFGIDTVDLAQHLGDRGLSGSLKMVSQQILDHMGPDGMVLQDTMKNNANATKAMSTIIAQLPPDLAQMSKGLQDGTVTQKEYGKAAKDTGGHAGALANQLLGLYKANSGVNDNLKAGKPALETYNAAMRDVFGNVTAARAATMLLMNDSHEFDANIKAIGEAGKKTGQDISTWADMQSTLSVKMDETKQTVNNLGIEMGNKLLPATKDLVGGISDLFHGFEQGNPVIWGAVYALEAITAIAVAGKIVGGVKSISKTVIQMAQDTKSSTSSFVTGFRSAEGAMDSATGKMGTFGGAVSRALPTMGKLATGAGIAAAAFKGLSAAQDAFGTNNAAPSLDQTTNAMLKLGDATSGADDLFQKWDDGPLTHAPSDVHNLNDAIGYTNDGFAKTGDAINKVVGFLPGLIGVKTTDGMDQVNQRLATTGQSLGQLVDGGSLDKAARAFAVYAKQQAATGGTTQDLLDKMPAYRDALLQQANAAHVSLSQQEQNEFALGRIPQKMKDAADATQNATFALGGYVDKAGSVKPITPELQKSLDDAGVSAEGLATDLQKVLDGMLATGMKTMSTRDATANFAQSMRDAASEMKGLADKKIDIHTALDSTGKDFDLTTEAGAALNGKLQGVITKGEDLAKSFTGTGADAQKNMQAALKQTYDGALKTADSMIVAAGGTDENGVAADTLVRKLMNIPPNVSVQTWMDDTIKQKADAAKAALDAIPPRKDVTVVFTTDASGFYNPSAGTDGKGADTGGHSKGPGAFAMGGLVGFAGGGLTGFDGGGVIPGIPPSRPNVDNILATVNGKPLKVRSGEFITNEPMTKVNMPWLKASNAGLNIGSAMQSRYAQGVAQGAQQSAPQYAMAGGSNPAPQVTINAQTNASAQHIAAEVGWALRTK